MQFCIYRDILGKVMPRNFVILSCSPSVSQRPKVLAENRGLTLFVFDTLIFVEKAQNYSNQQVPSLRIF